MDQQLHLEKEQGQVQVKVRHAIIITVKKERMSSSESALCIPTTFHNLYVVNGMLMDR